MSELNSFSFRRPSLFNMRLLHVETRELEYFEGKHIPEYAILSHCWIRPGSQEVTFQDLTTTADWINKSGYEKIDRCCKQALKDGCRYCWIDTCCIDKSSSAELSEAINSMYGWYQNSKICYAYLDDVKGTDITSSRWFTRGWTLQELIAPREVKFYNKQWEFIGERSELKHSISKSTGMPSAVLQADAPLSKYSVAEKMKWASKRETTKSEDLAYCLLGIFDVSMPLIPGEGARAFQRLQEQILKQCPDLSILAWTEIDQSSATPLAPAPSAYASLSSDNTDMDHKFILDLDSLSPTAISCVQGPTLQPNGLVITLCLIPYSNGVYLAPVCSVATKMPAFDTESGIALRTQSIVLQRGQKDGCFRRIALGNKPLVETQAYCQYFQSKLQRIILAPPVQGIQLFPGSHSRPDLATDYGFKIDQLEERAVKAVQAAGQVEGRGSGLCKMVSRIQSSHRFLSISSGSFGIAGMLSFSAQGPVMVFCLDFDFSPFCLLLKPDPARKSARPGTPDHRRITIPSLSDEPFCFGNNKHMLSLADMLRSGAHGHLEDQSIIRRGGVTMFQSTWTKPRSEFQVQNDVIMVFETAKYGYDISLRSGRCAPGQNSRPKVNKADPSRKWVTRPWVSTSKVSATGLIMQPEVNLAIRLRAKFYPTQQKSIP